MFCTENFKIGNIPHHYPYEFKLTGEWTTQLAGGCPNYRYILVNLKLCIRYSKTPIYRGGWGKGNIRGKSGSAVNRGFVWFTLCILSPIWGKGNGCGISGFAINRGTVYRGFTVISYLIKISIDIDILLMACNSLKYSLTLK